MTKYIYIAGDEQIEFGHGNSGYFLKTDELDLNSMEDRLTGPELKAFLEMYQVPVTEPVLRKLNNDEVI